MIKGLIRNRLSRRERAIARVCCIQVLDFMKKKEEPTDVEKKILPELEKIIEKLEIK